MKAEHRKELQTNALADGLGRFIQNLKSGKNTTSVIVYVFLFLAIGLVAAWRWFSATSLETRSSLWSRFEQSSTAEDYDNVGAERGTVPGMYARFQAARVRLNKGLQNLNDSALRPSAVTDIIKARDEYTQLADLCNEPALLHQEALMGIAKAEEALLGVAEDETQPVDPKNKDKDRKINAEVSAGNIDRVIAAYRRLAQAEPQDTFLVQAAKDRVRVLEDEGQRTKFVEVYAKLRERAADPRSSRPTLDPRLPPGHPPFGKPGFPLDPMDFNHP